MRIIVCLAILGLAGCASSAPPPERVEVEPVEGRVVESEAAPAVRYERVVRPGDAVLSAVGSPFLIAFKGIVCAASVVVAAPAVALVTLSEPRLAGPTTETLSDGLASNCGPPYVISPYRYVPVAAPEEPVDPDTREPM